MSLTAILLALAATTTGGSAEDEPAWPAGVWRTEQGEALVRIRACDAGWCGAVIWMADPLDEHGRPRVDVNNPDPALRSRPVLGLDILRVPSEPDGEDVYRGGRIYDPKSGKTYRCTLRRNDDGSLRMRGYIGLPILGRSTRWSPAGPADRRRAEASIN